MGGQILGTAFFFVHVYSIYSEECGFAISHARDNGGTGNLVKTERCQGTSHLQVSVDAVYWTVPTCETIFPSSRLVMKSRVHMEIMTQSQGGVSGGGQSEGEGWRGALTNTERFKYKIL